MTEPRVFCIGLNRTGTTTLGDACQLLGYSRLGWERTEQSFFSHRLLKAWERGDTGYLAKSPLATRCSKTCRGRWCTKRWLKHFPMQSLCSLAEPQ